MKRRNKTGVPRPLTRLAQLAERLETTTGWGDLTLPEAEHKRLREIADRMKYKVTMAESFRLAAKVSPGGMIALFAGPSGSGKTMAAAVLAHDLKLDLYRVDLGRIVSKYIGETEKNLDRIFKEAEEANVVLYFDEADALLARRTEVKDSHDRYANVEVAYLLQRMESYRGLVILATNFRRTIDDAFVRRLDSVIEFPGLTDAPR